MYDRTTGRKVKVEDKHESALYGLWLHGLATAVVNDSLKVQDTWVPIEMLYLLDAERPMIQTAVDEPPSRWQRYFADLEVPDRPKFYAPLVHLDMTAAEGLKRVAAAPHFTERRKQMFGHHVGDPRKAHADDWHKHRAEAARAKRTTGVGVTAAPTPSAFMAPLVDMGSWPPFRSVDAGLRRVETAASPAVAVATTTTPHPDIHQFYFPRERARDRTLRAADTIETMIAALSGFVSPTFGEPIRYANAEVAAQQRLTSFPLFISFHRDLYEFLVSAGRHADVAVDLATSLSPQSLWYLAVIAFSSRDYDPEEQKGDVVQTSSALQPYQVDVKRAAMAILEALPGPTFPVQMNFAQQMSWELRPRRQLHGQWFVDVPMRVRGGDGAEWEPMFLPETFFHRRFRKREGISDAFQGVYFSGPDFLYGGLLYKRFGVQAERGPLLHHFLWYSAGLACVAPASLLFHRHVS
jgi:hypothetical protein